MIVQCIAVSGRANHDLIFHKINLSFSLASSFDEEDEDQAFAQDLLDFFVDSIGATLTDINDAELK